MRCIVVCCCLLLGSCKSEGLRRTDSDGPQADGPLTGAGGTPAQSLGQAGAGGTTQLDAGGDVVVRGRGSTDGGASEAGGQVLGCQRESDCPAGMVCGYPVRDGCGAIGHCIPRTPAPGDLPCNAIQYVCSCSGVTETVGCNYYSGYAPAPVRSTGPCPADASIQGASCGQQGASCETTGGRAPPCCQPLGCSPAGSASLPGACVEL